MKIDRHGQGKIFTTTELNQLFIKGFKTSRDKALFAICLFTACRISEALQLEKTLVTKDKIIFKKGITKGKLATREIPITKELKPFLIAYQSSKPNNPFYFPGYAGHLSINQAHKILNRACKKIGIEGASTHSFRRTALTQLHRQGIPLRVIQAISGHRTLTSLQRYLEVTDEDKAKAIFSLNFNFLSIL